MISILGKPLKIGISNLGNTELTYARYYSFVWGGTNLYIFLNDDNRVVSVYSKDESFNVYWMDKDGTIVYEKLFNKYFR